MTAESRWHNKVVNMIKEIAEQDYSKVRDGNSDPIVLYRKGKRTTCEYRPDVIAEHDFPAAIDVYEVVDSEPITKAVLDIIQFLSIPGKCKLRMICSNRRKLKQIQDMARILLYNLKSREGEEEFEVHCLFTFLRKDVRNVDYIRRRLKKEIHSTMTKR